MSFIFDAAALKPTAMLATLRRVLEAPTDVLLAKRRLLAKHAPDVLWDVAESRVVTNILRNAQRCGTGATV